MMANDGFYWHEGNSEDFDRFWRNIEAKISGYYPEDKIDGLASRMANYFADFPTIEDLDDIDKHDLIDLLFSEDFYADIKR
ncbi:MAG: hypothetical protein [Caudoviricetes sp.]|nr:MAG: hypothetical protein [Caudoviricetes sp.]